MRKLLQLAVSCFSVVLAAAEGDYQRGVSFYKQGQYAKAAAEFEQLVEANPKYEDGFRLLGDCYLKQRKYGEAVTAFQKALQLNGNNFASYLGLALGYFNIGKYRDCIASLVKAERMARTPKDQYQLYRTRGAAYFNVKDFENAAQDLLKANSIQRVSFQDVLQLGISYFRLGNLTEAEKYLRQAVALNGASAEARRYVAQLGYAQAVKAIEGKDYEQASALLTSHLANNPEDAAAWFNLGLARLFSNDLKGAEDAFAQSVRLDPDNWRGYDRLGYIYEKTKNYRKALQNYSKASGLSQNALCKASVERVQERLRREKQGSS